MGLYKDIQKHLKALRESIDAELVKGAEEYNLLKAEVERLKQGAVTGATRSKTEDSVEIWGRKFYATPPKPVVWLRDGQPCDECGHRVDYDESVKGAGIEAVREWLKDAATVREYKVVTVTVEPHEWVHHIYEVADGWRMATVAGSSWFNKLHYTLEGIIKNKMQPSGDNAPDIIPDFGIRRLKKREIAAVTYINVLNKSVHQFAVNGRYGAFRNGEYINGSYGASPESCIILVLDQLTSAVPARKLSDLEVAHDEIGHSERGKKWYRRRFHHFRRTEIQRDYQAEMDEARHEETLIRAKGETDGKSQ